MVRAPRLWRCRFYSYGYLDLWNLFGWFFNRFQATTFTYETIFLNYLSEKNKQTNEFLRERILQQLKPLFIFTNVNNYRPLLVPFTNLKVVFQHSVHDSSHSKGRLDHMRFHIANWESKREFHQKGRTQWRGVVRGFCVKHDRAVLVLRDPLSKNNKPRTVTPETRNLLNLD